MATVKFVILPNHPLKDGRYRIKLAVSHKKQTCYISTRFHVDNTGQFSCGQVIEHPHALTINRKLRGMLDNYEEELYNIDNIDLYTCQQVRSILISRGRTDLPTFQSVTDAYIRELEQAGRHNYALLLERNSRYFHEYSGVDIPLEQITPIIVANFTSWLRTNKHVSDASVNAALSRMRTIINRGIKYHNITYTQHPFVHTRIQASPEKELDITTEQLIRLRDCQPSCRKLEVARNIFMLSYYLAGMNLVDMLNYNFKGADTIDYTRFKTRNMKRGNAVISFTIQPEAWPLIEKYMNKKTGKLDFGYKFSYTNFSRYITRCLHQLAEEERLPAKLVFYSARKSFVQHGFDLGIPLETLEYCIGQSMKKNRPIFNYVRIMRKHADDAIRKILSNLYT